MPQMQMRLHVVGVNRGVISDNGQTWAKVQTTEDFEHLDDNTIGQRACDVSASFGFLDQIKAQKVVLPADLEVMATVTITKTKARLVVDSLIGVAKVAGK